MNPVKNVVNPRRICYGKDLSCPNDAIPGTFECPECNPLAKLLQALLQKTQNK